MARCTTLCDKVCQRFATSQWFSPGTPVSSTNKTDCHNVAEILLKEVLKHHNPNLSKIIACDCCLMPNEQTMFQLQKCTSWHEKLHFNQMMMSTVLLDQHN